VYNIASLGKLKISLTREKKIEISKNNSEEKDRKDLFCLLLWPTWLVRAFENEACG